MNSKHAQYTTAGSHKRAMAIQRYRRVVDMIQQAEDDHVITLLAVNMLNQHFGGYRIESIELIDVIDGLYALADSIALHNNLRVSA